MDTKQYYSNIAFIAACALAVLWAIYSFLQHNRGNEKAKSNFGQGLVALAVFTVLAVIILPVYAGSRPIAAQAFGLSNAKQTVIALSIYRIDNGGLLPPNLNTQGGQNPLLPLSTKNPSGPAQFHLNPALAGKDIEPLEDKPDIPLIYDPNPFPDGTFLVGFTNGESRMVSKEEWERLKAKLRPAASRETRKHSS